MDKTTRMHMVSPLFESGKIWSPDKKFADEVIEEVASFPNGDHDDCDSMTMALMRFRQGGLVITLQGEELDEWGPPRKRRRNTTNG